jgi:hypothetical protein
VTSIGHTFTGLALSTLVLVPRARGRADEPRAARRDRASQRANILRANLAGCLANAPDFPFPGWGHDAYAVSHSFFVNGLLFLVYAALVLSAPPLRRWTGGATGALVVGAAWLGHMLLDSFYAHGRGLAVYWPLSDAHLALPIPIFETLTMDPVFSVHNLRVFAIELVVYGALLAAAVAMHRRRAAYERAGDR